MHIIKKVFISLFYSTCLVCQYFVLTTLSNKVSWPVQLTNMAILMILFVLLVLTLSSDWKKSNK